MAHWAVEHAQKCLGTSLNVDSCKTWVSNIYDYLLAKKGQPVPLAEIGLNVKKPAALGKKYKLLSVMQEDMRFKWFRAPTRAEDGEKTATNNNRMAYLAVAVEGPLGELLEGCISRESALSLVSGCGKTADAQEQLPARLPPGNASSHRPQVGSGDSATQMPNTDTGTHAQKRSDNTECRQ